MNSYLKSNKFLLELRDKLNNQKEPPLHIMQEFYTVIKDTEISAYSKLDFSRFYFMLLDRLSSEQIKESVIFVINNCHDILLFDNKGIQRLIQNHPDLADWLYKAMKQSMTVTNSGFYLYMKQISEIIVASVGKTAHKLFNDLEKISDTFRFMLIYAGLNYIYANKENLRKKILLFIIQSVNTKNHLELTEVYKLMNKIIKYDKSVINVFLELIEHNLKMPCLTKETITEIIYLLSEIYDCVNNKDYVKQLLINAQQIAKDDLETVRIAARKLNQTELLHSNLKIGKRIKSEKDKNWLLTNEIPIDKLSVLIAGGDGTTTDKSANGYAKKIQERLNLSEIYNVDIYSVVYDFGDKKLGCDTEEARKLQMKQYGRKANISGDIREENLKPEYVKKLFNVAIRPRLERNNKRLPFQEAMQNIRNIVFVVHCNGGYAFLKLEELMQETMAELGYLDTEKKAIQKQLICIAHAPYCPLGVSKSTMISFASAKDYRTNHFNKFQTSLQKLDKKHQFNFSYFPEKNGNIFVATQIYDMWFERDFAGIDTNFLEHDFTGYEEDASLLTIEGVLLKQLSGNAIVNAVKNAMENKTVTDINKLVSDGTENTEAQLKLLYKNGHEIYEKIVQTARVK